MTSTDSMMMNGKRHSEFTVCQHKKGAWFDWLADELEADNNGWDRNEQQLKKGKNDATVNWADPFAWQEAKFAVPTDVSPTSTASTRDPVDDSEVSDTESYSLGELSCDSEEEFGECDLDETEVGQDEIETPAEDMRYKHKKGAWSDWLTDELEAQENGWDLNSLQLNNGKIDATVNWADPHAWEKAKTGISSIEGPTCSTRDLEESDTESCAWVDVTSDSEEEFGECESNDTYAEQMEGEAHVTLEVRNAFSGERVCIAELRLSDTLDKLRQLAASELKCACSYVQLLDGQRILDSSETLHDAGLGNGSVVNVLRRPCFMVTSSADHTAKLWDTVTGECFRTLSGHTGKVNSAVPSPDNQFILTSSGDGTVRLWVTETGECACTLRSGHGSVLSSTMSPDGEHIAIGTDGGAVLVWSIASGECTLTIDEGDNMPVRKVDYSPDGRFILTANGTWDCGTTTVWDADSGEKIAVLCDVEDIVLDAHYSPDGSSVVTGCGDDTVTVWNASNGELQSELEGHDGAVYAAEFSPNGRRILTGSSDCTAKLWNAKNSQCINTLKGHLGEVSSVSFSADGALVATGSMDNTARIWTIKGGTCKVVMEGHASAVLGVSFSRT